jgi:hypothetical protein
MGLHHFHVPQKNVEKTPRKRYDNYWKDIAVHGGGFNHLTGILSRRIVAFMGRARTPYAR